VPKNTFKVGRHDVAARICSRRRADGGAVSVGISGGDKRGMKCLHAKSVIKGTRKLDVVGTFSSRMENANCAPIPIVAMIVGSTRP
jgi:hypothetical protein